MVASQNGWRANDPSVIGSFSLPGGSVSLHVGSPGQALALVGTIYHHTVEPLLWPGCWGYASRPIRGGTELSNHASGTALDLCAPRHPLGTDPRTNFSPGQLAAIRRIADVDVILHGARVIRWGGDYGDPAHGGVRGSRPDGMHWEVNDGVTEAQLAGLVPNLQRVLDGILHPAPAPAPSPAPAGIKWGQSVNAAPGTRLIGLGSVGPNDVAFVQRWHGLPDDGYFGYDTQAKVKATQTRNGLTADGLVGPATWKAILAHP